MFLLIALLLSAVCFDLKTYRIPNRLILAGFLTGILYMLLTGIWMAAPGSAGWDVCALLLYAGRRLLEMAGMVLVLIPFWKCKAIGGGDVKLAGISTLYIGFAATARSLLYAGLIACLIAGVLLAVQKLEAYVGRMPAFLSRLPKLKKRKGLHLLHFSIPFLAGVLIECAAHIWLAG